MKTERKIGEIFEYNGEWYQCVESKQDTCTNCAFNPINSIRYNCSGSCAYKKVIFKKLEKVGDPFERNGYMYQEYKTHIYPLLMSGDAKIPTDNGFAVITKQIKENMEENKLNLKPFDLQKVKEGNPVCTRDGRWARIICFDRKDIKPIVALVTVANDTSVTEKTLYYFEDGHHLSKNYDDINDLMMLPKKKSGWINIYKGGLLDTKSYSSKEEAAGKASKTDYIDTIKIEWEE